MSSEATPRPPSPVERAFDRYLDAVRADERTDREAFVASQPEELRAELRRMIDDYLALRSRFGERPAELRAELEGGGYRLVRELGRGGMGVVWEAEELATGRRVALKVLTRELQYSDEAYERFRREAQLAASVAHPSCVFVYGVTEIEQRPAIAMELAGGETLQDRIDSGESIPVDTAVAWVLQLIDGLEAAKQAGVLHRDVKPANCFLMDDGAVKIGDWGISRTLQADGGITRTGQFIGSPLFASPEQVRCEELDGRTDIYSLGATLYALLAGRPPFEDRDAGRLVAHILEKEPPRIRAVRKDVPLELERVVRRMMARDRKKRIASYARLRRALAGFDREPALPHPFARYAAAFVDWILMTFFFGLIGALHRVAPHPLWPLLGPHAGALYYLLFEGILLGRSPAKAAMGLRVVVDRTTHVSRPRVFLRSVVFWVVPVVCASAYAPAYEWVLSNLDLQESQNARSLFGLAGPLAFVLFVGVPFLPRGRRGVRRAFREGRTLLDVATGTRLARARRSEAVRTAPTVKTLPSPGRLENLPERVGGHRLVDTVGETPWGHLVLALDERLRRNVWLDLRSGDDGPSPSTATSPLLPRLLEVGREDGWVYHAYEPAEGRPLLGEKVRALGQIRESLVDLERLATLLQDPEASVRYLEQLWLDDRRRLRVLPVPVLEHWLEPEEVLPHLILAWAARGLLPGLLPAGLDPGTRRLLHGIVHEDRPNLATVEEELRSSIASHGVLDRPMRLMLIGVAGFLWFSILVALMLVWGLVMTNVDPEFEPRQLPIVPVVLAALLHPVLAWALRGGLSFTAAGVCVRMRSGAVPSRLRCALRALLAWTPFLLLFDERLAPVAFLIYMAIPFWMLFLPHVSPTDLVLGTQLTRCPPRE